jgi:hypothetical protein
VLLYYSTCLFESFAPSTVYVLLLHVTTISTVHLQPACSLHSLLRLQQVYIYVYIYVYAPLSTLISQYKSLYILLRTAFSTVPGVYICLYLASSLQPQKGSTLLRLYLRLRSICGPHYTSSAAHHLPCFQGGKECMATLHSSDRDLILPYRTDNAVNPQISLLLLAQKHFFRTTLFLQRLNSEHSVNIFVTITTQQAKILSSAPHHIQNLVKTFLYQRAFPTFTNFFYFFTYRTSKHFHKHLSPMQLFSKHYSFQQIDSFLCTSVPPSLKNSVQFSPICFRNNC